MTSNMRCHSPLNSRLSLDARSPPFGGIRIICWPSTSPLLPELIRLILHVVTGLFNTFTFWMLSSDVVSMQNRLFSVFMTLTIAPPLIQQLQPRFLSMRRLFDAREGPAKLYRWITFVVAAFVVEIPWSLLFGTIFYFCWYWGVGFPRGTSVTGYTWLMLMAFEVFYVSFGQMLAAISPNDMFASLLVPASFPFLVAFCGVLAPPKAMPHFWSSWMYCKSPLLRYSNLERADSVPLFAGGNSISSCARSACHLRR
jgi:ABC-type multidrug transport system permease subunit